MTTTEPSNKKRTNSQCREWERNRRNKFNDAITKLGEVVREFNKSNDSPKDSENGKNDDNTKYPKVEIVHKAILCITNCAQEKTQLRSEILALRVKLDGFTNNNNNTRKDVATQVHMEIHKKSKNGKHVKLVIAQQKNKKGSSKLLKENKIEHAPAPKLPSILPRNIFDKKAPENAIVVLPAAPYIFPQRPLLFPNVPPAIVVIDNTLQTSKKSVPIVSRNSGDITKTTMVNILPISAYSRPLSATKNKKNNVKLKSDANKKLAKKNKTATKSPPDPTKTNEILKSATPSEMEPNKKHVQNSPNKTEENETVKQNISLNKSPTKTSPDSSSVKTSVVTSKEETVTQNPTSTGDMSKTSILDDSNTLKNLSKVAKSQSTSSVEVKGSDEFLVPTSSDKVVDVVTSISTIKSKNTEENKTNKDAFEKTISTEEKDKENKLPNLLDSALCDNVVDGGNARLELAEEFLAASPTAAFLMSFPLVSGNRADSPAEEPQTQHKDNSQKRNDDLIPHHAHTTTSAYLVKPNNSETKSNNKTTNKTISQNKSNGLEKLVAPTCKAQEAKSSVSITNENPFLSLPMPTLISTNCTIADTSFGLDFDCNLSKPIASQSTSYVNNSNIFYKNDPFSTVKNTIYSTSNISSSHEFNALGLYPCAMEKYASKNKSDFTNMDENNLMKIGSSRLTYDIDLGWSHKGFEFVSCPTTSATLTTLSKDNTSTTVSCTPFCTSYNPLYPDFHVSLASSVNKKDVGSNKVTSSFADTLTNFYSQPTNLWSEEPFFTNTNVSKSLSTRHQNYIPMENVQGSSNIKQSNAKHYETKDTSTGNVNNTIKTTNHTIGQQLNEKYTKKSSPNKMHINWMTSEIRPMQNNNNCIPSHTEIKEPQKMSYDSLGPTKRLETNDSNNYFPLSMPNFSSQAPQEDFHVWPSTRPLGTTEISIDPPPINLPTLVGDLALGPHDKKKNLDSTNRIMPHQDIQNCSNFFSVTQLMNRSNENSSSRYQPPHVESSKSIPTKQNIAHYNSDNRKVMPSRVDNQIQQPYLYNDSKLTHSYENMPSAYTHNKKSSNKPDKAPKPQKNNYSAEAILRGGNFSQKIPDHGNKFIPHSQKYSDFNAAQDTSVAQVSHFPPIIDYTENSYAGQQLSGTSLYNTTTNTISNSFYSNFMPGSSNLMSGNYTSGPFPGEFIDYNQSTECNYSNHKYEELKMRNNPPAFPSDKVPYKSSRRDSASKHKLECSKKESSKKYQSKRAKMNNEVEEWSDPAHSLWQNKTSSRKHPNLVSEDLPFSNYVSNQMPSQYQPDFFNSHLMSSNMQPVGHNVDRSLAGFPITSRANFNLSTIFPEITMKVQ